MSLWLYQARTQVANAAADAEKRQTLTTDWMRARGAAHALSATRAALLEFKLSRLDRRRSEAIGNCLATSQATIAHKHGKRTLAEVAGAQDLLRSLSEVHASMPLPMLSLKIALPSKVNPNRGKARLRSEALEPQSLYHPFALQLIEDCLLWMGWPDRALTYQSHSVDGVDNNGQGGNLTVNAIISPCDGMQALVGSSDPQRLGDCQLAQPSGFALSRSCRKTASRERTRTWLL